jgi:CBS domain-containing protein
MSSPLANITVNEVMSLVPYSISSENTVSQAYGLMRHKRLGGLPVVENGNLIGVITRIDIKKVNLDEAQKTKVRDVMSKNPITVCQDEKVSVALEKMTNLHVSRMPVMSSTGSLVGWLSLSDIEKAAKILRSRKLDTPQSIKCPECGASLPFTISRTVTCQHCGKISSI